MKTKIVRMNNQFKFFGRILAIVCAVFLFQSGCAELLDNSVENSLAMQRNDAHILATHFDGTHAVMVDGCESRPGGTLFFIEKDDDNWSLKQTIDLDDVLVKHSPLAVVCNGQWMALTAIPKIKKAPAKIVLFKKVDGEWELVSTPASMSEFIFTGFFTILLGGEPPKEIALSNDNQLFIGQETNNKGKVFRFDLNTEPISMKEIILPPEENAILSSIEFFGRMLALTDDFMIIDTIGACFSEEEIGKYGIIVPDSNRPPVNGVYPPPHKNSLFAYKFNQEKDQWEYITDFFEQLPHPPGEILRQPVQIRRTQIKGKPVLHYLIESTRLCAVTANRVFLKSDYAFYKFKTDDGSSWEFDKKITPHTLPTERNKIRSTAKYTWFFDIGEKYSTFFHENTGFFEIYLTEELEDWQPLWEIPFDTEYFPNIEMNPKGGKKNIYIRKFSIKGNSIFAYYLIRTFNPKTQASSSIARVIIYDIDDDTGPKISFQMDLTGDKFTVIENPATP
jgi:hypothetical protein